MCDERRSASPGRTSGRSWRTLHCLCGLLGASCVAASAGCDAADPALAPSLEQLEATAIAWLEPVAESPARGRFTFVGREDGVHVRGAIEGAVPDARYALELREAERCAEADAAPREFTLVRAAADRAGALEHEGVHAALGRAEGPERLDDDTLVLARAREDGPGEPVACGRVRFIGFLTSDSEGRWQGVRN